MYDIEEIGKKKLLIFDMDGTLFDTSESNYQAYHDAAAELGYIIERDRFMELFTGKNYKEFLPEFGIAEDKEQRIIHDHKKAHYKDHIGKIKKNDILFSVMDKLRPGRKFALATTASRKNTMDILEFFHVTDFFDYILTQEDVKRLKPDPECYIRVMEHMGISPKDSVVFEDSEVGIMAAASSGASYVKVDEFR